MQTSYSTLHVTNVKLVLLKWFSTNSTFTESSEEQFFEAKTH